MRLFGSPFQQKVLERLDALSPVYVVGGAVRDQMLGIPGHDVDAVTALSHETLEEKLREWGYYPHRLGQRQLTITLFDDGDRLDFTHLEGELFKDAARRDFTINAMYYRIGSRERLDPCGGEQDLEAKILRACGDPGERFAEDPIRVLRMVRFAVKYGFRIEERTWEAAGVVLPTLAEAAKERVTEELGKILILPEVEAGLRKLDELGYFQAYLPELARLKGLVQNRYHTKDAWEHTIHVVANTPPVLILRLAALWHDLGKWDTASRECRVWGKMESKGKEFALGEFVVQGKGIERWKGQYVEVLGGRLDHHPERVVIKRIFSSYRRQSGFEWVLEGKRHFLSHERESARLAKQILPRFAWSMVLRVPTGNGEKELLFLIENHMGGTLAFMDELRGEGKGEKIREKAERFAWTMGWDGRDYRTDRLENLLAIWQADFFGGKQREEGDKERFLVVQAAIREAAFVLAQRWQTLDWEKFHTFAQGRELAGEDYGTFKAQVMEKAVLRSGKVLLEGSELEREYARFLKETNKQPLRRKRRQRQGRTT